MPWLLLLGSLVISVLMVLSIIGYHGDHSSLKEQNLFGGYGTLHTPVHHSGLWPHFFYDDACIYFQPGTAENGLMALDIETGAVRSVCQRPFCKHDTPDCVLYSLYADGFLYYFPVDDAIYCYQRTGENELLLRKWNIAKRTFDTVAKLPGGREEIEDDGRVTPINYGIEGIERVNADTILVRSGGIYLFDNDFNQKKYIANAASGSNITWTEHALFWMTVGDFCFYDLDTDTLHENVLAQAGESRKPSCRYFYAYDNRFYFTLDRRIVCYDLGDGSISDMGLPTLSQNVEERIFRILDGRLFYRNEDEGVHCRDLRTGADTALPDMQYLPVIQIDKYLVNFRRTPLENGGWRCSCILFDLNGKKVKESEEYTVTP